MPDDIKPTGANQALPAGEIPPATIDMSLPPLPPPEPPASGWPRLKNWLLSHKKITLPAVGLILIIIIFAVPFSRYKICGLFLKQNFSVKVVDATTNVPVSGADVAIGKQSMKTDAGGLARLRVPVGQKQIKVNKKYYLSSSLSSLVPIFKQKSVPALSLKATGRQVNVVVADLISGKSLADVDIEVAGISAKTDAKGQAQLVLPAGIPKQQAVLSVDGYNDAKTTINVSDQQVAQNKLAMTPVGKVYFLSNRNGSLDVMKVNLDGTSAQTVIQGTPSQQVDSTSLIQSPDGKYIVLEAKRQDSDKTPQLYILATADDQLYNFDSGDTNFSIVGWSGDSLVYTASSNTMADWQPGKQKLKSYDASTGKTTVVDSTAGTDPDKAAYESYGQIYLTASKVVFTKNWYTNGSDDLSDQKDALMSAGVTGQVKQTVTSYVASSNTLNLYQYAPNNFYLEVNSSGALSYYDYAPGGNFKKVSQPASNQLYLNSQFYFSADASQSFWSEQRDGKQTLITGDVYGSTASQKVRAAGYDAAGWYTDKYLLATNVEQSELYILSANAGQPVKLTSYQPTAIY